MHPYVRGYIPGGSPGERLINCNSNGLLKNKRACVEIPMWFTKVDGTMSCLIGHKWNGCKCEKCGKTRDSGHDWTGRVCRICGAAMQVKKTAGSCCICGRSLYRNPDQADRMDNAARYCYQCGTDICVHCLQKLGGSQIKCPVCGENVIFEINPLFRPK